MSFSQETRKLRLAIIGGGLGGLALAVGLKRTDLSVHIYEAAAQFSEIGAGVVFGANAIRALGLIDPALLSGYRKHATANPPGTWLTYRYAMKTLEKGSNMEVTAKGTVGQDFWTQHDNAESGYVHRARLLEEMIKLIPAGTASFNKRLLRIEDSADNSLTLFFEDGTTAVADAVVGCDGIKSSAREYVCGKGVQPAYSGQYAYRQLFPMSVAVGILGQERAQSMTLECGYGAYIIHYPIEDGTLMNMTAVRNDPDSNWNEDTWLVPTSRSRMLEDWTDWDPRLLELMSHIDRPERRALFDLKHDKSYSRGQVCLLGDSAHATTPHNGAGAAMAMEDAYVLSRLLSEVDCLKDLGSTFKAYDSVRRPRTQRLIEVSRSTGLTKCFMLHGVLDDPTKFKEQLESAYRWIWDTDLEAQLEAARDLVRGQP